MPNLHYSTLNKDMIAYQILDSQLINQYSCAASRLLSKPIAWWWWCSDASGPRVIHVAGGLPARPGSEIQPWAPSSTLSSWAACIGRNGVGDGAAASSTGAWLINFYGPSAGNSTSATGLLGGRGCYGCASGGGGSAMGATGAGEGTLFFSLAVDLI